MPDYNLRYAGSGTMMGGTKPSKAAAHYTPAGGRERCGQCRHFVPASACNRIVGPVSALGWCSYFSREMAVLLQPGATYGGGTDPNAPAIDLSLMGPTLDPSITFTRTSANATYFDVAGTMQTAAANTPRFDYDPVTHVMRGLLLEEQRINILLNSAALGTQSVTVTAQLYTLSFYGTGTVTLSGTSTAGPLTGSGAFPARVSLSFTPTAGTLTLTVTGSVLNAQLEAGQNATSYILTAGATATRTVEQAFITAAPVNSLTNTLATEYIIPFIPTAAGSGYVSAEVDDGTINNTLTLRNANSNVASVTSFVANVSVGTITAGTLSQNVVLKHAATFSASPLAITTSLNGAAVVSVAPTSAPPGLTRLAIGFGRGGTLDGWIRRVRYWPRILSNAELQAATT